ncbi:vps51/Vps67 domain-containing protein [Ditylenchus destructor]|uniref:Vacuolar protein sorting-associated protein 51 homolog n=1 Tax=Ditylenchus destructor TaxID=166010 RepID=A0AAD4NAF9_9BILA|nr:vps51/Vps67 domain-containing protein [Ditylenchus destructor]
MNSSEMDADKHPLNLNSSQFDSEAFVSNLLQRKGLDELVAVEEDMVQNVRRLDSEMQQLVYENYNKFLTATNTVRSMQSAFTDMDNEMRGLSAQMKDISTLSETLSESFNKNRDTVRKLTDAKKSIERLQCFVKLPQILQDLINEKKHQRAVEIFMNAKPKLEKYREVRSLSGIYSDSMAIMSKLETQFRDCLKARIISSEELLEAARLLRSLNVMTDAEIQTELLTNWRGQLDAELRNLGAQVHSSSMYSDVLEFVNDGGYNFLTNLSLHISLFTQLFSKPADKASLMELVESCMLELENILNERFRKETNPRDCALFVSALDKISRKIAVFSRFLPGLDFSRMNASIVVGATKYQIEICRESIRNAVASTISEIVEELSNAANASDNTSTSEASTISALSSPSSVATTNGQTHKKVTGLVNRIEQTFLVSVKTCLANLLLFTANDTNFSSIDSEFFYNTFGVQVYENIVVGSVQDMNLLIENKNGTHYTMEASPNTASIFLILSLFLRNLQAKQLNYLMDLCQEQFKLTERKGDSLTDRDQLVNQTLKIFVEKLLRNYAEIQCTTLMQIVDKNISSFDWSECASSPRSVRLLTKHLHYCFANIDKELSLFISEGSIKKEQTPDSLRSGRRAASAASTYETASLNSSIMERLWGDDSDEQSRAEGDGGSPKTVLANMVLEFRRDSVLNAIVRVTLKHMAESVLQHTFSPNGLQQLQVDCGYLKHQLWQLVVDEHVLNSLIEEIVTSAVNQCSQPKLLEPVVVREICERS